MSTPRMDAAAVVCYGEGGIESSLGFRAVPLKNASQLETELAEMTAIAKRLASQLADFVEHVGYCNEADLLACDTDKHPPSVFTVYAERAGDALTEAREKGLL